MSQAAAKASDSTLPMFTPRRRRGRSGDRCGAEGRAASPARADRADRLGEHRLARRAGGGGLGADQQIRRGLSRPALLRRLRGGRQGRAAGHRARLQAVRLRFANVQPHSGAQANQAVFMALLQPGDTFMGMALDQGGHLTHGSPANQSGKWFKVVSYGVKPDSHLIDYEQMEAMARQREAEADHRRRLGLFAPHRLRRASARSPTRSAPSSWSTWRTMPAWSRPASIPARCRTPMS